MKTHILAACLLALCIGCGDPAVPPVKVGDFVRDRLTGEVGMVAATPRDGLFSRPFYGVRFKDGRARWYRAGELQRMPRQ